MGNFGRKMITVKELNGNYSPEKYLKKKNELDAVNSKSEMTEERANELKE